MASSDESTNPSSTPNVAVSVIPVKDGKVLMGCRIDGGFWECPGGKLNWPEHPDDCARRELREETGLEAHDLRRVDFVSVEYRGDQWIVLFYEARVDSDPRLIEADKSHGWGWYSWDELPQPLLPGSAALLATGYRPTGL